jgi:hypothetical protein
LRTIIATWPSHHREVVRKPCTAINRRSDVLFLAGTDLHNEFLAAVIGAMNSSADLSAQILNNPDLSQRVLDELVPIIYKGLKATA